MTRLYLCIREPAAFDAGGNKPTEAEALSDRLEQMVGAMLEGAGIGRSLGTAKVAATFGAENGRAGAFTLLKDDQARDVPGSRAVAAVFDTSDPMVAESIAWNQIYMVGAQDRAVLHFAEEDGQVTSRGACKSIEVYYDIAAIPDGFANPLDFRNEAMSLIERPLEAAGAGEWAGAEIGMGEVNFGFEVEDFDRAEAIVRGAVKGTLFDCIREITRVTDRRKMTAAE